MRNGKGDIPRPSFISPDEYADNFDRAFKKGKYSSCSNCSNCSCNEQINKTCECKCIEKQRNNQ